MDLFEAAGYWSLDEASDRRLPGTLRVSRTGRVELEVIGSMRDPLAYGISRSSGGLTTTDFTEQSLTAGGSYARINGETTRGLFTLLDCFSTRRTSMNWTGIGSERIHVHKAIGCGLDPDENAVFDRIVATMNGFASWVGAAIDESWRTEDRRFVELSLAVRPIPDIDLGTHDGAAARIVHARGTTGNGITERSLTQDFRLRVEHPVGVPVETLLEEVGDIQDLVSIGTGLTAAFSSVAVEHPDLTISPEGSEHRQQISIHAEWNPSPPEEPDVPQVHNLFFSFADLGPAAAAHWRSVASKHRSALSRVMHARYNGGDPSDRLLTCAAAIEAYHRPTQPRASLRKRLNACADLAGQPFSAIVGDVGCWSKRLVAARHDIAHHNPRIRGAMLEHLHLGVSAHWLFVMCLLRDSNAPDAVFDRIIAHDSISTLRAGVESILA